jgi:hypothetical protein
MYGEVSASLPGRYFGLIKEDCFEVWIIEVHDFSV